MKIRCIAGENACPPEDVGGPHSYFEFLAAIKDPTHEEHSSMSQWMGGSFDPAPGGHPASPTPGRLKLLHPEVERAPVGAEG